MEPLKFGKIDGVLISPLRWICDERGRLMEMMRSDDPDVFISFGMNYVTTMYPGVTKGWHYHERQKDNFVCVHGMIKLVLHDLREGSPTHGFYQEIFLGDSNPRMVQIPELVWHGFKNIGTEECLVVNTPTQPYNRECPDEIRCPVDHFSYSWTRKDG